MINVLFEAAKVVKSYQLFSVYKKFFIRIFIHKIHYNFA